MRPPKSLQWRIAAAYTALIIIAMGAVAAMLTGLAFDRGVDMVRVVAVTALVATGAGVLAVILAFLLARSTTHSMRTAADSARRLADGDLEHRLEPSSLDEDQELANAFNRMAEAIHRTVRDLESEQGLLAIAMDTMADGVIVLDPENRIRFTNRAAEWFAAADRRDSLGRPLSEVVRDHELLQLAARSSETRQIHQAEIMLLHQRLFLNVIATPISGERGEGVLLTLQDVTRLRQVETTRREFVSNVSHELRSPLASVRAMVETLEGGALRDPDVALDFLGRIESDIQRMTTLVDELLELSRLESGQMPVHLAPLSVSEVAGEIVARFEGPAAAAGVKMGIDLPPDLPYVMAETGKLDQILTNLLENALRFTPEGGRVDVSASTGRRWVKLTVSDTGIGIPSEHLPHVFERFYKVDRSRRDGGAGLGLAIAKHLVQAHGGDISVSSAEGQGSSFNLTLQRAT